MRLSFLFPPGAVCRLWEGSGDWGKKLSTCQFPPMEEGCRCCCSLTPPTHKHTHTNWRCSLDSIA